jgi:hypothetical protein
MLISKLQAFLVNYMTYFKKKKIHLSEGPLFQFFGTKTKKRLKRHKINKKAFAKIVLDILCQLKLHEALST